MGTGLAGLGVLLLFAANWRDLGKTVKLVLAFLPLLLGQGLCAFTLLKREDSPAWREASSTLLFLAGLLCLLPVLGNRKRRKAHA